MARPVKRGQPLLLGYAPRWGGCSDSVMVFATRASFAKNHARVAIRCVGFPIVNPIFAAVQPPLARGARGSADAPLVAAT